MNDPISTKKDEDGYFKPMDDSEVEDGFGSIWSEWCPSCGHKAVAVMRPGEAQCMYCE